MTVLVDSDILIEVSRARDLAIASRWAALSQSDVRVLYSPISEAELWAGVRPTEQEDLTNLLSMLICVPIDAKTAAATSVRIGGAELSGILDK